jgi:hypothetical protein
VSNIVEDTPAVRLLELVIEAAGSDVFTARGDWVYGYVRNSATELEFCADRVSGDPYTVTVTVDTSAESVSIEIDDDGSVTTTSSPDYGLWIGRLIAGGCPNLSVTIGVPPT